MSLLKNFINPEEFTYDLPQDRIALFPLPERDKSKLLFYHKGKITHHSFSDISGLVPENSMLIFNNTRVIPARLHFRKPTGALIEIFLLSPVKPGKNMEEAMQARGEAVWECLIGNLKRWHNHTPLINTILIGHKKIRLTASIEDLNLGHVKLSWDDPDKPLSEIILATGKIPLPPYIDRDAEESDKERYQTIYSRIEGAVASSTAGLHFTEKIFLDLKIKKIKTEFITLHIGAGTFQPIKAGNAINHEMHSEQLIVTRENIENILSHNGPVIAVGTTSLRTLESVYWFGTALLNGKEDDFLINKLDPYYYPAKNLPALAESLNAILAKMKKLKTSRMTGSTGIYILPGYKFRVCNGLITNFHLPGSTLILLVAAFAGNDWKRIYSEAIMNDYRFLSYGDTSILIP
jgi:S-adenosylmethionine:tRNA ribosyltransferase-isomerase